MDPCVFEKYHETYLDSLPQELKNLLLPYIYGKFYIVGMKRGYWKDLWVKLYFLLSDDLIITTYLPITNMSDLKFWVTEKIPPDYSTSTHLKRFFHIYHNAIVMGENPTIKLRGDNINKFLQKLRLLYEDLTNNRNNIDEPYFY